MKKKGKANQHNRRDEDKAGVREEKSSFFTKATLWGIYLKKSA